MDLPNSVGKETVMNKVIAWLFEAPSNVPRGELCDLLMKYFAEDVIEVAKEDIIRVLKENNEELANDNEVKKLLKCRRDNRRFNEANDLLHIMIKLSDIDRLPVILLLALEDTNIPAVRPESNDVTLVAKVAVLKFIVTNLVTTVESLNNELKTEIRGIKPTMVDVLKARNTITQPN